VIWGLDFFSFDGRTLNEVGFDPKLSTWLASERIMLTATLSIDAVTDAWKLVGETDYKDGDGCWMANGLKVTNDRSSGRIAETLERERQNDYIGWQSSEVHYKAFERSVKRLVDSGVRVTLFISPIHVRQQESIIAAGKKNEYDEWVSRIIAIAQKNNVDLWDFTKKNPFRESSLDQGSNSYYIDASHYKPDTIGKWILQRIGAAKATEGIPEIGVQLTKRTGG
jgi:hypothetical protein